MTYFLGIMWLALSIAGWIDGEVITASACTFAVGTTIWSSILEHRIRILENGR